MGGPAPYRVSTSSSMATGSDEPVWVVPVPTSSGALCEPQAALSGFDLHVTKAPVPADGHGSLRAVVTVVDGTQGNLAPVAVQFRPMSETPPSDVPIPRLAGPLHLGRRRSGDVIRVLWSARGFDQGGSQLRMAELVERLSYDGGFHSTVLSPTEGPLRSVLEAAGATVHVGLGVPLDDAAEYERSLSHLAEWMDGRFDLVVGFAVTSFPAVDVASRVGVPSVLRIGEAEPLPTVVAWLFGPLNPDVERQARRAVTGASVVLSNSHAAVENYRAHGYAGRFVVLATGVDVAGARAYRDANDREECRRRLAVRPDERFLLCAASLWTVKGQAVLVTALDSCPPRASAPHLRAGRSRRRRLRRRYLFLCRPDRAHRRGESAPVSRRPSAVVVRRRCGRVPVRVRGASRRGARSHGARLAGTELSGGRPAAPRGAGCHRVALRSF